MRARNLKPAYFTNELLAVADPLYGHIFCGLWCMADREGRLEDRPARIHMTINGGRAFETTERSLAWLAEQQFIVRYEVAGQRLILVVNFGKHQNPHHREPPSNLPPPIHDTKAQGFTPMDEYKAQGQPEVDHSYISDEPRASPRQTPHQTSMHGPPAVLIPDSGFRIPDNSPSGRAVTATASPGKTRKPRVSRETAPDWWLDFKLAYPDRAGDPNWRGAIRAANARMGEGYTADEFIAGARRYAAYIAATGKTGTEYVQQASRFLGPSKPFLEPWNIPRETPPPPARSSAVDRVRQATGCDLRQITGDGRVD